MNGDIIRDKTKEVMELLNEAREKCILGLLKDGADIKGITAYRSYRAESYFADNLDICYRILIIFEDNPPSVKIDFRKTTRDSLRPLRE